MCASLQQKEAGSC